MRDHCLLSTAGEDDFHQKLTIEERVQSVSITLRKQATGKIFIHNNYYNKVYALKFLMVRTV